MFIVEWIVVGMVIVAGIRALARAVVDGIVQVLHPDREAPSLAARRARVEIAQRQFEITGSAGVGQAIADRLGARIANPPPRAAWIDEALGYFSTLLADEFAKRRQARADRQDRKRGAAPTGKRCWRCDVGVATDPNGLCDACTTFVVTPCDGCGQHMPAGDLRDGTCAACRAPRRPDPVAPDTSSSPETSDPARLVVPTP